MDKGLIKRVAGAVHHAFNIATPVIDIAQVVENIGGKLVFVKNLPPYVYGEVEKHEDAFIIRVSDKQTLTRLRFTIAHELGHLFLHMGYKIDDDLWKKSSPYVYRRNGNTELEQDANEFAANFLMPECDFKAQVQLLSYDKQVNIDKLAAYFNVSVDAALNRGKWLGIFPW